MASRYYEKNNTGIYVLELEGNFTRVDQPSVDSLEKAVEELLNKPELNGMIIYQVSENLRIGSMGTSQIISLCASLSKRPESVKPKFVGVRGTFAEILKKCRFDKIFKRYDTLEEALADN
ncbi:hypothetical protein HYT23_01990 [Candidatus Pacearchaeota archaeon]|nr:hypothetical protein [Candidatus Pacearchaeota archaeon]